MLGGAWRWLEISCHRNEVAMSASRSALALPVLVVVAFCDCLVPRLVQGITSMLEDLVTHQGVQKGGPTNSFRTSIRRTTPS